MTATRRVLVLGGGIGGVVAANLLRKRLPGDWKVTLIDREERHVFAPSLLWVLTGERTPERISRPLARLESKGIEIVRGEIQIIDPVTRTVRVEDRELAGEYIVLSLGAQLAPEDISGLSETGHSFYSLSGAKRLRQALEEFTGGRLVVLTATPAYKCPAAPYEAAMLLQHLLTRKRRLDFEVAVYAAEPAPMGTAGPHVSRAVQELLKARGIPYFPGHQVEEVDADRRRLHFAGGGETSYDILAFVPPHRAPSVVQASGLAEPGKWVPVDRHTLATRFPRVFAVGDVTGIPLDIGKPLPKAGVFAHGQAEAVSSRIADEVAGKPSASRFSGRGECFLEMGGGRAGFARGDFYATPAPSVRMYRPGRHWHIAKQLFERTWFRRWL